MQRAVQALLGGMLACAVAIGVGRFAFTPILPVMQAAQGYGAQGSGWLAAANNLGYLIGALWAGGIAGPLWRHRTLAFGLIILAASLVLMPATTTMPVWLLLRFVAGIASAWVFVLASAEVVPCLSEAGHARWTGLHFGGVGAGIVLAGSVVGPVATIAGADQAWLASFALAAILGVPCWLILRRLHLSRHHASPAAAGPGVQYPLIRVGIAYFCEGLGYIVTGTFLVAILRDTPGLEDFGHLAWVAVGLAALPSALAWTWVAEHVGYRRALIAAHLLQAGGIVLPALIPHPAAAVLGALFYGGTFLGIVALALAFGRAITPERPTRTIAWLTAGFGVGQCLGPILAAWLAAANGWPAALLVAAAVTAFGAAVLMPRPSSSDEMVGNARQRL